MIKNFNITGVQLKIRFFFFWEGRGRGVHEFVLLFFGGRGVNRLKRGAWIVCRFKRGLGKGKGHVFDVGRG